MKARKQARKSFYAPLTFIFFAMMILLPASCTSTKGEAPLTPEEELAALKESYSDLENRMNSVQSDLDQSRDLLSRSARALGVEISDDDFTALPGEAEDIARIAGDREALAQQLNDLEDQLRAAKQEIAILSEALNQARFAESLFGSSSGTGPGSSGDSARTGSTAGSINGTDDSPADSSAQADSGPSSPADTVDNRFRQVDNIFRAGAIGRSEPTGLDGSPLVTQVDDAGDLFLSHEDAGYWTEKPAYLEIHQRPGVGLGLYLVLQVVYDTADEPFGLYSGDLNLAGAFLYSLPGEEYRENLADPAKRVERLYIPVNRTILQAIGRMVVENRGEIILKGESGERRFVINAGEAAPMREVLSSFIEIGQ